MSIWSGSLMRQSALLFGAAYSALALAAPAPQLSQLPPVIPLQQELVAVDYFREGRQSGCGLRITGEAEEYVWINVLVSVFLKETGQTFGVFKVSAKTMDMKDGAPLLRDGKISYTSIGKIHKAWLKTASGMQPDLHKSGKLPHIDGYMASLEFGSAMELLVAIPQASFRVGVNRTADETEEIFEFSKPINPNEANKLLACMKNLRKSIEDQLSGKSPRDL